MAVDNKKEKRLRRHLRVRKKVMGTAARPRLCVFKSLNHTYAQIVDDEVGHTKVAVSTLSPSLRGIKGTKTDRAREVGRAIGRQAREQGIEQVVFDRGGYKYHGRVKALAEGARESGLKF
ncbi:MAG: large subunit ribosomal protein [Candidatus Atribacteria bacterium]|nr:large subunit ribosomal protein [Candidatus Atribacteria bacterium]